MTVLTAMQVEALQELLNIGAGRSAAMLNRMVGVHIRLQVPLVEVVSEVELVTELQQRLNLERVAAVRLGFSGSCNGMAHLVFPFSSAARLVTALMSEDTELQPDLDAIRIGALSEVGNVVLNGVMGEISKLLHQQLKYSIPAYAEVQALNLFHAVAVDKQMTILLAQARLSIEQLLVTGDIILLFNIDSFDILLAAIKERWEVGNEWPTYA
ncbi:MULTISPECIES: chemotaxis protein CheC [unclassified Leptolyngbya]|uniref:chemotaxis protein CheC n=1 Tax=unclassified Leptolyngbya TaxID=2650499 RepID=UPI001685CF27|nr:MULTISPECIES: chemotaxis protein CheC [unclassified Leptolyngbya]MBD1910795.1 chemotaxis protein CheC [Leptolyngbya sp. FACHB-8]MBD2158144.1 chemotaxis protein CheC [Leptolyngbya sp. FACHB-16]